MKIATPCPELMIENRHLNYINMEPARWYVWHTLLWY